MFAAALLPWCPYIPPPSLAVRRVTEPASEVTRMILAPCARDPEVALGLVAFRLELLTASQQRRPGFSSRPGSTNRALLTGATEQMVYMAISSSQLALPNS